MMPSTLPHSFLLLIGLLLLSTPAGAQENPDPLRFADDIAAFEAWDQKNATPPQPVLFVGSSSIVGWPTAARFPTLPVINRGFGGSHISDVLHYFDRVVQPYAPRALVFYAGDNDIAGNKSAAQVLADYQTFTERVHAQYPQTDIFFIPIKPSLSRWDMWPEMAKANQMIAAYSAEHPLLHYIDTATPMLGDDQTPDPTLFVEDGLHLNPTGYDLWTKIVQPYLAPYATPNPE